MGKGSDMGDIDVGLIVMSFMNFGDMVGFVVFWVLIEGGLFFFWK